MSAFQQSASLARAVQLLHAGDLQRADAICRQVLAQRRNDHQAHAILGQIATMQTRFGDAVRHLDKAISIAPREVDYHLLLAEALESSGRHREALARYDRALKLRPHYPPALAGKANVFARTDVWDKARGLLEPYVARAAEDAGMALVYARAAIHDGESGRAVEVASRHLEDRMREETRRALLFEIGRAHEKTGDHDAAFEAYSRANRVAARPWDPVAESERYDRIMAVFTREFLEHAPHPGPAVAEASELLVFIVGLPRSGSTLIEQIIAAHPEAHGAGELLVLPDLVDSMGLRIGSTLAYPECLRDLDARDADELARAYLDQVRPLAPRARRITDKYLGTYEHLGLIALLFPRARIIHCRRHPLDTCLSCFVHKFAPGVPAFTEDLVHLGLIYNDYLAIMDHWRGVLPEGRMIEVDYEALVEDQEPQSRRIIEHCGLAWDERCLRYYESGREVLTLSRDQVNKPIYRSSVGRYRHYEAHLGPLKEILASGERGKARREARKA